MKLKGFIFVLVIITSSQLMAQCNSGAYSYYTGDSYGTEMLTVTITNNCDSEKKVLYQYYYDNNEYWSSSDYRNIGPSEQAVFTWAKAGNKFRYAIVNLNESTYIANENNLWKTVVIN